MAKPKKVKEERYGALSFRQAGGDKTGYICRWEEHPQGRSGSGRWKVELLDQPLFDREGSPLRCCDRCLKAIKDIYLSALLNEGKGVAA